jgi:hypothetical protein
MNIILRKAHSFFAYHLFWRSVRRFCTALRFSMVSWLMPLFWCLFFVHTFKQSYNTRSLIHPAIVVSPSKYFSLQKPFKSLHFLYFQLFSIFLITAASDSTALVPVDAGMETRTVSEFSMSAACYQIAFHSHPPRHCSF